MSTFVPVQMVLQIFACRVKEKNNYKVSNCFFENTYVLILKIVLKVPLHFCSGFASLLLGISPVYIHGRLLE